MIGIEVCLNNVDKVHGRVLPSLSMVYVGVVSFARRWLPSPQLMQPAMMWWVFFRTTNDQLNRMFSARLSCKFEKKIMSA